MRILGIDPGYAITGYSIISVEDEKKWQKIAWKIIKYTFIVKCRSFIPFKTY